MVSTNYFASCNYSARLLNKLNMVDINHNLNYSMINKAIYWAKKYHGAQLRKTGEPFYSHPLEVAYMVVDQLLSTDVVVASILHDIVEDTEVTVEMILANFGWRAAEMVDRLTRDRPDGIKLTVLDILNQAYQQNDKEVLLIKLYDRLHNIQTLAIRPPDKIKKVTAETLNFFMIITIFMGCKDLEQTMYKLCCDHLAVEYKAERQLQTNEINSYLDFIETSDSHQIVAQVFQNVISQE